MPKTSRWTVAEAMASVNRRRLLIGLGIASTAAAKSAEAKAGAQPTVERLRGIAAGRASDLVNQDNLTIYPTFAGMSKRSVSVGVNALRTNGYTAAGDGGGALYRKVGSEPPHEGKFRSIDGAWWEIAENVLTLEMFGGKADGAIVEAGVTGTDNSPAIENALNVITANISGVYGAGPRIQCGYGSYRFSQTIKIKKNVTISGISGGGAGNGETGTRFLFPADTTGIKAFSYDTIDQESGLPSGTDGSGSILDGLVLQSAGGNDRTKHGISQQCRLIITNCRIHGFPGNGHHISDLPIDGGGNVNNWEIRGGRVTGCQNGIFTQGGDTNAGVASHVDCSSNRQAGILDRSFLGNLYIGCHENGNGVLAQVSDGVSRYRANPTVGLLNDPTPLSSTPPGSNPAVWEQLAVGGDSTFFPMWVPGGEYVVGGQKISTNANARTAFIGGYSEPGWPANFILAPAIHIGGTNSAGFHPNSTGLRLNDRSLSNVLLLAAAGAAFAVSGSGIAEVSYAHNIGAAAPTRGASHAFYVGYLPDGITKRHAGDVYARATSANMAVNTAVGLRYYDARAGDLVPAIEFNGATKEAVTDTDDTWSLGAVAKRWLSGFFTKIFVGAGATFWTSGAGSPEGVLAGPVGSLYTRIDGGSGTTLYVKETGSDTTGWVPK